MQPVEWSFEGTSNPNNFFDYEPGFMIREYNRDPYPASRISIPALNSSSLSWTSASVIWFDDSLPNFTPVRTDGFFPGEYLRPFSAWAIPVNENIVDIYAKRTYTDGFNTNNGTHSFFVPLINKSLSLLQNKDYGFVRFKKDGGIWVNVVSETVE